MRPIRPLTLAAAALAAAALLPAAASAAPAVDGVYDLPARPQRLAPGPDGNVWVTLDDGTNDVARVAPDGTVTPFATTPISFAFGIVAGPDGNLWVTQSNAVVRFSPADPGGATAFPVAGLAGAKGIVVGADGNLWTAAGDTVFRIATDGRSTPFTVAGMSARGIAAGGDGRLYVADFAERRVVAMATDGRFEPYAVPEAPQEVAGGPASQIAVAMPSNLLGRFTPPGRDIATATVAGTDPFGIVSAADLAYWAANFARDSLTRMTPAGDVTTLTGFPAASGPRYLTTGANGTLWVGLESSSQVARVTGVTAPSGGGGGGGGAADTTRPRVSQLSAPARLRVGKPGTLRMTLSEAATVTVRIERRLPGRRKGGRCVPPRRVPHGTRCVRVVAVGTQRFGAQAGANRLRVGGRIGRRVLPAGRYRLTIVARDAAGNASAPATRRLLVVVPPRR